MSRATLLGILMGAISPVFAQVPEATSGQVAASAVAVKPVNQRKVDPAAMYHRLYAVVPMIGTGTKDDPFRPMFVPLKPSVAVNHSGILSFQMQASDDGKFALVEIVSATREDLLPVITSTATGVVTFERGSATQEAIEAEFQKYKKNFKLSLFNTRAQ